MTIKEAGSPTRREGRLQRRMPRSSKREEVTTKQKYLIGLIILAVVISLWLNIQALQSTAPKPEIIYMSPTLVITATPTPTQAETPNTTATANITAEQEVI